MTMRSGGLIVPELLRGGPGDRVWTVDFASDPEDSAAVAEALRRGISAGVDGMEKDLHGPGG
jgi:hypothetical protein